MRLRDAELPESRVVATVGFAVILLEYTKIFPPGNGVDALFFL
jgi:hypothetical protein